MFGMRMSTWEPIEHVIILLLVVGVGWLIYDKLKQPISP